MSNKWHNKFGARIIKPKHFSYESDDIEVAKEFQQERLKKEEELIRKVKTYSEEDKY